jgi:hypothetical protein
MYTEYALGISSPPTQLHLFSTPVPAPMISRPEKYSVVFDRGDGSMAGHGFPQTIWELQVLTETEKNALQDIVTVAGVVQKSRSVYIVSRSYEDMDTFVEYSAVMVWPQGIGQFRQTSGLYFNVPILFRKLVIV